MSVMHAVVAVLILTMLPSMPSAQAQRVETSLNAGWRFHKGEDDHGNRSDADVSNWPTVTLPHSYNGGDGDRGQGYYRGAVWYRRTIVIPSVPRGKRAYLQFDGAALRADVYVNGHLIGRHDGGFARFRFDVTDALHAGSNILAVRVDNSRLPGIAPLGGDFTVFGGLYRPVSLVEVDETHIDLLDHGGPGVYSEIRSLTEQRAEVTALVMVRNDAADVRNVGVDVAIRDAGGRVVATNTTNIAMTGKSSQKVPIALTIPTPHRWNGRLNPYLYSLVATTRSDGGISRFRDEQSVPLGLRTATFEGSGFMLNGRAYPLHGVNYFHPERPGVGIAVTEAQIDDDVATLDEMGVTSLRLVHFQHPQRVYDDADRLGLPVWTEIPLNGLVDAAPVFRENVEEQLRELISQNRNHPSVILWGLGNEVYATDPTVLAILTAVQSVGHDADASRPTVYAHCCQSDDNPKAAISDVIGFNRYFGWYPEQRGTIGEWADGFHAAFPKRSFAVSEYGAGGSVLQQQAPPLPPSQPGGTWHPEQGQTAYHILNWRQLRDRRFLFGSYVWVAFDVASDGRREGDRPGINDKGLITYDRAIRKDAYYWYQANWSQLPMLHVLNRRLNPRASATTDIAVVSNLTAVTLSVNGQVKGTSAVSDHIALFEGVPLRLGSNSIVASGVASDARVEDTIELIRQFPSSFGIDAVPAAEILPINSSPAKAPPGQ